MIGKELKIFLLLACVFAFTVAKPMIASKILLAINCGSKDQIVESFDKVFKYQPDANYVSGKSVDVDYHTNEQAKQNDIKYTFDKRIYMFERHTYDEMIYTLPVKNGKVTLILKFAEMYFQNSGQRVFNIKIGNTVVRRDLDVVKESGSKFAAHEEYIEIEVKTDGVYFEGTKIPGGLVNGKIKLAFTKGKADNPIVQAIVVYHDSIENSPQQEFKQLKIKWETQKQLQKAMKEEASLRDLISIQKKKEKVYIRNDQLIIQKNEEISEQGPAHQKFGFLRRLLMGPIGILGWSALFGVAIIFLYKNIFKVDIIALSNKSE